MQAVGQDQAAQIRNFNRILGSFLFHVGNTEQYQRRWLTRWVFPMTFNRGDLRRLMLKGVQTVGIAQHRLNWRNDQRHPHRHRQHFTDCRRVIFTQQVPRRRSANKEGTGEERRGRHMQQAEREGRVKDNLEPVNRDHNAVLNGITLRGLHPAVRGEDPEGRDQGAQRHHTGREEVQARTDTVPAEQHHAQEARFEEERGKHFVSQQRTGHAAGKLREATPVGAELIRHDQAGHHAHTKVNGEDF